MWLCPRQDKYFQKFRLATPVKTTSPPTRPLQNVCYDGPVNDAFVTNNARKGHAGVAGAAFLSAQRQRLPRVRTL